jgi:hypothetical protein
MPTVADLIRALPQDIEELGPMAPQIDAAAFRPLPVGRLRRIGLLTTLQSKIFAAYLFYWLRKWFADASDRERLLAEAHWRAAVRVLDSMGYLRGATMKFGQMLGQYPNVVPAEFTETLAGLHFSAPPMHFSLLREMVFNELGDDPENIFASFDKRAFAAASLGQVHRARLWSGEGVAVKIQYPGIARTISDDLGNLAAFMLPARLSSDWENTREQFEDLRARLEQETDYVREVATLQKVRSLFHDADGIVVPRLFPQHCTERVITMERLEGLHLSDFLATSPSQERRNDLGRKLIRAWYRMLYAGRLVYADMNPGNFLFMDDGRLGVIDFGCMVECDDELWEMFRRIDRPLTTGEREPRIDFIRWWSSIGDSPEEQEHLRLMDEYVGLLWSPRSFRGEFDFGDESYIRRSLDYFAELVTKRYTRGHASSPMMMRQQLGMQAILYRLKAKFEVQPIAEEEVRAAGWDRSGYAPR